MATEKVTYKCGHTAYVKLYGSTADRERKIKYIEEYQVCPECKARRNAEENRVSAQKAEEAGLPNLVGTEKQVAWATTIRDKAIETINSLVTKNANGVMPVRLRKIVDLWLESEVKAAYWIENRDMTAAGNIYKLLQKYYDIVALTEAETEQTTEEKVSEEKPEAEQPEVKGTEEKPEAEQAKEQAEKGTEAEQMTEEKENEEDETEITDEFLDEAININCTIAARNANRERNEELKEDIKKRDLLHIKKISHTEKYGMKFEDILKKLIKHISRDRTSRLLFLALTDEQLASVIDFGCVAYNIGYTGEQAKFPKKDAEISEKLEGLSSMWNWDHRPNKKGFDTLKEPASSLLMMQDLETLHEVMWFGVEVMSSAELDRQHEKNRANTND